MNRWKWYAVSEGFAKTASNTVSKIIGLSGSNFGGSIFITFIIGSVQGIGGLMLAIFSKQRLFPGWKLLFGAFFFGASAFTSTVAGLYALTFPEADIGVFVFITLLGLLPGIFIDQIFFKTHHSLLQWIGVFIFLCGGYGMLNFPSLGEIIALPPWVLITLIIPVTLAINEGLTRAMSRAVISNPFVNNFWIGLTTVALSACVLLIFDMETVIKEMSVRLYGLAALIGAIVLIMISLKLLAYKGGGTIGYKKIIMQGTHLISAVIIGLLFFGESLTVGKGIGIIAFFVSMFLMEFRSKTTMTLVS